MDLSHMLILSLEGNVCGCAQGVAGLVGVYGPTAEAGSGEGLVYPVSVGGLSISNGGFRMADGGEGNGVEDSGALLMRAGVGLIGELVYGAEGVTGFEPRVFGAVNLPLKGGVFNAKGPSGGGGEAAKGEGNHAKARRRKGKAGELGGKEKGMGGKWEHGAGGLAGLLNRGSNSMGVSDRLGFVDDEKVGGVLERLRVVGFLERSGEVIETCVDSLAADAMVWAERLNEYVVFGIGAQCAGDAAGAFGSVLDLIAAADRPTHVLVVGCYAPWWGGDALQDGDVCHVVVYDERVISISQVREALSAGRGEAALNVEGVSWLRQEVKLMIDD